MEFYFGSDEGTLMFFMRACDSGRHSFGYFSVAADRKVTRQRGEKGWLSWEWCLLRAIKSKARLPRCARNDKNWRSGWQHGILALAIKRRFLNYPPHGAS